MTIKLIGNFDAAELCNTLAAHFGSQEGWCLSEEETMAGRVVVFTPQKHDLDISGVQAIFDAHGAIDWKLKREKESYRGKRAKEYPPIGDQLDALWKGGQDAAEMKATIDAIKAKYPKPV